MNNDGICECSNFYFKDKNTNLFNCLGEDETCVLKGYEKKLIALNNVLVPWMIVWQKDLKFLMRNVLNPVLIIQMILIMMEHVFVHFFIIKIMIQIYLFVLVKMNFVQIKYIYIKIMMKDNVLLPRMIVK